jgi:predicted DCC family thiol-disulfide oxidoreductase YuxK
MSPSPAPRLQQHNRPILLYNDECGVCRRVARWVDRSGRRSSGEARLEEQPIGADPEALRELHPDLDIWDAYATIHLLMPDGSMKLGGEAVAEVLRELPNTRWFAWSFSVGFFGFRPFQLLLNLAYAILSDVRPLLGCESCGTPSLWVRPIVGISKRLKTMFGAKRKPHSSPHFTTFH